MLIGLSGYAGSGKDTVGKILIDNFGFKRVAFADPVRNVARRLHYWNGEKDELGRMHLQAVGNILREELGDDLWIRVAMQEIDDGLFFSVPGPGRFVVTDVRYENEIDAIKVRGGKVMRVIRHGQPANDHISEALPEFYDRYDGYFVNDGTVEDLTANVVKWYHDATRVR